MPAAPPFTTQVTIRASARRVFQAFVSPEAQIQWYTNRASMNLAVGERCQFEWNERRQNFDEYWTVAEIKIGRELRFGWENFGRMGGLHARVAARFTPVQRDRMRLSLRHTVVRDPEDKLPAYRARWRARLDALKDWIEGQST